MVWYHYDLLLDCLQIDSNAYNILFYGGGGALVTIWLASAIVGAIDSIPLVSNPFTYIKILDAVLCLDVDDTNFIGSVPQVDGSGWARLHSVVHIALSVFQGRNVKRLFDY